MANSYSDLLPVYNYRVTIANETTIGFSEVSGLSIEHEPVVYKHGLSFAIGNKIIPGMRQALNVTLQRALTTGSNAQYLWNWFHLVYSNPYTMEAKRDITISLGTIETQEGDTTEHVTAVRWKVSRALPTQLEMPTFSAEANEVAVESLSLVAHGLSVEYV